MKDYESAYMAERTMREEANKLKHVMTEKSFRFVFRVTLQLLDNSIGQVSYDAATQASDLEKAGVSESTGHHLAIFECELKTPPTMAMVDHSIFEFVMGSSLPFRNWKLVDVDNYMKGNPPFSDFLENVKWETDVQNWENGKTKRAGYDLRTRQDMLDKIDEVKEYAQFSNTMRQPNSNDRILFIQQREEEVRLAAAAEKAAKEMESKQAKKGGKKKAKSGEVEEVELATEQKDEAHNLGK
jgi:hypothetical protein